MSPYENRPGQEVIWDSDESKLVVSDGGSRVDYYEGSTHSWSYYNNAGELTGGGVGETHPHETGSGG